MQGTAVVECFALSWCHTCARCGSARELCSGTSHHLCTLLQQHFTRLVLFIKHNLFFCTSVQEHTVRANAIKFSTTLSRCIEDIRYICPRTRLVSSLSPQIWAKARRNLHLLLPSVWDVLLKERSFKWHISIVQPTWHACACVHAALCLRPGPHCSTCLPCRLAFKNSVADVDFNKKVGGSKNWMRLRRLRLMPCERLLALCVLRGGWSFWSSPSSCAVQPWLSHWWLYSSY